MGKWFELVWYPYRICIKGSVEDEIAALHACFHLVVVVLLMYRCACITSGTN